MKRILDTVSGFFRDIGGFFRSRFKYKRRVRKGARIYPAAHKASAASAAPVRAQRRSRFRIRDQKRLIIIAAAAVAVITLAIVLPLTLGSKTGQTATPGSSMPALPDETQGAAITLAMPVYTTLSISEGVSADVVADMQTRLMELGYMDNDEADGVYAESTRVAVEHFQQQHAMTVTGIVDQATLTLLYSAEAQGYTLTVGAESTDVAELQTRLYELGYIASSTGYFGTDTETAVKKFQKLNGLTEDGAVNKETRELLYSGDAVANAYSYGEQSPEILAFQNRLKKLGYLTTEPDGSFGADTKAAVARFQESSGLIADGYIGPATKAALMSDEAQGNALAIGAKGNDVSNMQARLKELGYISKATGYFGSETDSAVRSFQYNNRLTVDGKVGSQTMNTLMSDNAKKSTGVAITGANASSFIAVAKSKLGSKYVGGGKGPNVFDCSGFVYWCLNKVGVNQGYMTSHTWARSTKYTKITNYGDMKKGDIIVFSGHVAIYCGGGVMIDASSSNGKVVKRSSTGSWCRRMFICAFRVF